MSVAPNGRIDVIWNDTRNDATPLNPTYSEVFYSFSEDGGLTWSKNIAVTPSFNHFLGYPQQDKLGDYYDMLSDNSGASLAYAATFNGEQDVYFLRIGVEEAKNSTFTDVKEKFRLPPP
jgi:Neuraminidase (sialidase)